MTDSSVSGLESNAESDSYPEEVAPRKHKKQHRHNRNNNNKKKKKNPRRNYKKETKTAKLKPNGRSKTHKK